MTTLSGPLLSFESVRELLFKGAFYYNPVFSSKVICPVEVLSCNGFLPTPFSEARFTLKHHNGGHLCGLFVEQWLWLYKVLAGDVIDEDGITDSFKNFFNNIKHYNCLRILRDMKKQSHVQAILAAHLFGPLAAKDYIIDKNGFDEELGKCPGCDIKINVGDNSFGNKDIWYGCADIIVGRSTVEVDMSVTCQDENDELKDEDVEYDGSGEPAKKKQRLTVLKYIESSENIIEVKRPLFSNNPLYQALAQTITNAFLQVKESPGLSNTLIPSFLATEKSIIIQMYCCSKDLLLVSQELPLFEPGSDDINVSTIIFLWLTLNTNVPAKDLGLIEREQSKFRDFVKKFDKYSCYTEGIVKPLNLYPTAEKQELGPHPLQKFPKFDMLVAEAHEIYTKANKTFFNRK